MIFPALRFSASSAKINPPPFCFQQAGFICSGLLIPNIAQEVGDAVTAVSLVSKGFGVSLVSQATAALSLPGLVYRPLSGIPDNARVDLSCIYRADDRSPILAAFLEVVRAYRSR